MDSTWRKQRQKLAECEHCNETVRDGGGVLDEKREVQGLCELRHVRSRSRI